MFKLLILGESGVGKTCMLLRFAENVFDSDCLSTIGVDFKVKQIEMDGKRVRLQIWDSAGQERFRNITSSYYRNCSGIIIVYDVTKLESFNKVTEWISEVRRFVPAVPLIVVGNKCELEDRQVSTDDGKQLAPGADLPRDVRQDEPQHRGRVPGALEEADRGGGEQARARQAFVALRLRPGLHKEEDGALLVNMAHGTLGRVPPAGALAHPGNGRAPRRPADAHLQWGKSGQTARPPPVERRGKSGRKAAQNLHNGHRTTFVRLLRLMRADGSCRKGY
jgi:small GTP-binding protein